MFPPTTPTSLPLHSVSQPSCALSHTNLVDTPLSWAQGVDLWEDNGPAYGKNGTYGGFMYTEHVVKFIENHDVSRPLFAYVPFQNTHV